MNQMQRDKRAIRHVLELVGPCSFSEIALRAGEGLYPAMREMIDKGEVICDSKEGGVVYRLPEAE